MTIKRWDGERWRAVDNVGKPTKDALVKVRRVDSWELIWPPNITHVATTDGNWSDPNTWMDGILPDDGARVLIQSDVTVTVAQSVTTRLKSMRVAGTYRADPAADSLLRVETIVVPLGGRFELGTESTPIQEGVTAEIEFIDDGPIDESEDPDRVSKGLITRGEVEIVGADTSPPWTTLTEPPTAGDTTITLTSTPASGWNVGDEIVIPGVEAYTGLPLENTDEERTISAIDGATITLDSALEFDHVPPATDLDTYVLNLNRNVKFYSENTDELRRGHFMITGVEDTIKNLEMLDLGRTSKIRDVTSPLWNRGDADPDTPPNPRARYPLHFHRTGVTENPHVVQGCVVRRDIGWAYVNHGSSALIEDCISYKVLGAGFVAERGDETGAFRRNFALRSEGSGLETEKRKGWVNGHPNRMEDPPHNIDDFGHSGHGFWMHSPLIEVEDNVAAGHRHTGFTFWTRQLYEQPLGTGEALDGKHDMFPQTPVEVLTDYELRVARRGDEDAVVGDNWHTRDPNFVFGTSLPLRLFQNNVAFGLGGSAFDLRGGLMFRNPVGRFDRWEHRNNVGYNIEPLIQADGTEHHQENFTSSGNVGLDHRYTGNSVARGYRLIGTGDGIGVYRNHAYIDDVHIKDSVIENWGTGVYPPDYAGTPNPCEIEGITFRDNDIDVELDEQLGAANGGPVILDGNTYSGNTILHYNELGSAKMIPERFVREPGEVHASAQFEGRTVYHGWSAPDFVIVQEGDTARLDEMLNHGNDERWQEVLNGDNPRDVLPGLTHQELYDQYGKTYYGGMRDPDAADSERRDDFSGSGGTYDTTPFLGPADKTQPTDEIWVDVVNHCTFEGDFEIIQYGDGVPNELPISIAHDQTVVQLNRLDDRDWDLPVQDGTGIATYTFEVDRDGTYHIYCRAQRGESNDGVGATRYNRRLAVAMDGSDFVLYEPGADSWDMEDLVWPYNRDQTDFVAWNLTAGEHTIEIAGKGSGMRLDYVLIKHELCAAIPYGNGKPHTS